ncbi:MAG: DNA polymerase III subunit gamma/tau [Bacteroidales bacterium]|nr:DNA polymerase III subunit gamma/tau [Candidatus Cacconaster scatequi]
MEQFIVSARKYRPSSFETLLGQQTIARTLKNSIQRGQLAHAYLFCGPRGVGKTSAARIFAKTINCSNPGPDLEPCGECESCRSFAENRSYSIHELDAASNNSVEDIRALTEKVRIPPQVGKYSVYIIDEVHMLSQAAFNAFLKTLEEPPAHAIFILATTEKHKILPTILSRCQTYDFNRISIEDMVANMKSIASREGIEISEDAMHVIARKADGAMRDALTLFDQTVAFCGRKVTYEQVISNLNVLDYEYYFRMTDCFLAGDYTASMLLFDEILSKGFNAQGFVAGLSSHFRDLIISGNKAARTLVELSPSAVAKYEEYCKKCSPAFLFEALKITNACDAAYRQSGNPRLLIEFALMRICALNGAFAASAVAAAPAAAPAASPAPVPTPEKKAKSSGLSIKAMMQQAVMQAPAAKQEQAPEEAVPLSAESLATAWDALAKSESSRPSLSAALAKAVTRIEEESNIVFEVGNQAQKEWIEHNCLHRLENFLRTRLSNGNIKLRVEVPEVAESNAAALHMPSDKVEYLSHNSEEFRHLRDDFKLETS